MHDLRSGPVYDTRVQICWSMKPYTPLAAEILFSRPDPNSETRLQQKTLPLLDNRGVADHYSPFASIPIRCSTAPASQADQHRKALPLLDDGEGADHHGREAQTYDAIVGTLPPGVQAVVQLNLDERRYHKREGDADDAPAQGHDLVQVVHGEVRKERQRDNDHQRNRVAFGPRFVLGDELSKGRGTDLEIGEVLKRKGEEHRQTVRDHHSGRQHTRGLCEGSDKSDLRGSSHKTCFRYAMCREQSLANQK